jgi:hypothetical protein
MIKVDEKYNKIYINLTQIFLNYSVQRLSNLDAYHLRELFRVSLCESLDLETHENLIVDLVPYKTDLKKLYIPTLKEYDVLNQSKDFRQGLLECCVHCIKILCERQGLK